MVDPCTIVIVVAPPLCGSMKFVTVQGFVLRRGWVQKNPNSNPFKFPINLGA